jgi:hypothetical protein
VSFVKVFSGSIATTCDGDRMSVETTAGGFWISFAADPVARLCVPESTSNSSSGKGCISPQPAPGPPSGEAYFPGRFAVALVNQRSVKFQLQVSVERKQDNKIKSNWIKNDTLNV